MKFRLVESILNEDTWYKVDFEAKADNGYIFDSSVYVNAIDDTKNKDGKKQAESQVRHVFDKSNTGYKGLVGHEFDKDIVDKLRKYELLNIKNITAVPDFDSIPYNGDILSKNSRKFRQDAEDIVNDKISTGNISDYINSLRSSDDKRIQTLVDKYDELKSEGCKFYTHHMDEFERNNDINNFAVIPYKEDSESSLKLADAIHHLAHSSSVKDGRIKYMKGKVPILDLKNNKIINFIYYFTK